jgi:hypothetical protein
MKFETGKKYSDGGNTFHYEIFGRTEKTIKVKGVYGLKSRKVFVHDGVECCLPEGKFSMAPVIRANRIATAPVRR